MKYETFIMNIYFSILKLYMKYGNIIINFKPIVSTTF